MKIKSGRFALAVLMWLTSLIGRADGISIHLFADGDGTFSLSPTNGPYSPGTPVAVTANPDRYYAFAGWDDGVTNQTRIVIANATNNTFTARFAATVPTETHLLRQWDQSYGGAGASAMNAILATPDGGYLLGGQSTAGIGPSKTTANHGSNDCWLIKIDAFGNREWDAAYGGTLDDSILAILPTADGGYLLGCSSASPPSGVKTTPNYGGADFWIIKINAKGTKQWEADFGGDGDDIVSSMLATPDGGFVVCGSSTSPATGNKTSRSYGNGDCWVIKIDGKGHKVWDQTFGTSGFDWPRCLLPLPDGGFFLGGAGATEMNSNKTVAGFGGDDFWLLQFDTSGTNTQQFVYGGSSDDVLERITPTRDGGFLLGGQSASIVSGNKTATNHGNYDFWVVKIDETGAHQWDRTYDAPQFDNVRAIIPLANGRYVLAGSIGSPSSMRMYEIGATGSQIAVGNFGGKTGGSLMSAALGTPDGGIIAAGWSSSVPGLGKSAPLLGARDFWLVKAVIHEAPIGTPIVTANGVFHPDGLYTNQSSLELEMSTSLAGGHIYYTLDGSDPSTNSFLYNAPFNVTGGATVRAVASDAKGQLTIPADPVSVLSQDPGPRVVTAFGYPTNQTILVSFADRVGSGATNVNDYTLSNGSLITNAVILLGSQTVLLSAANPFATGIALTVSGVDDFAGYVMATNAVVPVFVAPVLVDLAPLAAPGTITGALPQSGTIKTTGTGFQGSDDSISYYNEPWHGDFDVAVRISSFPLVGTSLPTFQRAGLVARPNLNPNAPEIAALVEPATLYSYWRTSYRTGDSGTPIEWPQIAYPPPTNLVYPNVWVRLRRQGNVFTAFAGTNGTFWTQYGVLAPSPAFPETILLGLGVGGDGSSTPSVVTYSSYANTVGDTNLPGDLSWNTSSFQAGGVNCLLSDGHGGAYLGGSFSTIGGIAANNVAHWDGTLWRNLGSGVNGQVRALALAPDGTLYAGGQFNSAGGFAATNIARWNGTRWSPMGRGIPAIDRPPVLSLAVGVDGMVYAGGYFSAAGAVSANSIARWDGQTWSPMGAGFLNGNQGSVATVATIGVNGHRIYAGGLFSVSGANQPIAIAQWDGSNWLPIPGAPQSNRNAPYVSSMLFQGAKMYIGGIFTSVGNTPAPGVARWDGQTWSALGSGLDGNVNALAMVGDRLFAGGTFQTVGGNKIPALAEWDGVNWSALGHGLGGNLPFVNALGVAGNELLVVGGFTTAGGQPVSGSAEWTLTNLPPAVAITTPAQCALIPLASYGASTNVSIEASVVASNVAVTNVSLYVGGALLGTLSSPPYLFPWTNILGGEYDLFAVATDILGRSVYSTTIGVSVAAPIFPPAISLTTPTNRQAYIQGKPIAFAATASAPDGAVANVTFYLGTNAIPSMATQSGYIGTLDSAPPGDFTVTAVVTDNRGATAIATPVSIHIDALPSVNIISPIDGAPFYTNSTLTITVEASDSDGQVAEVALFKDGQFAASAVSPPYIFELVNLPAGTNVYTAQALDNDGGIAVSAPVKVFEFPEPPIYYAPTMTLSSSASNGIFTVPGNLVLTPQIVDRGAPPRAVNFSVNNINLGEADAPSFAFTLTNPPVGSYVFEAIMTDTAGNNTSATLSISIVPALTNTPSFVLVDLGTLGGPTSSASGINARGDVVGASSLRSGGGVQHAFIYTSGKLVDLGIPPAQTNTVSSGGTNGSVPPSALTSSFASAINNQGVVAVNGYNSGSGNEAFLWTPGAGYSPLASINFQAETVSGLNDSGEAVGLLGDNPPQQSAVSWTGSGIASVLPTDHGAAHGINGQGWIVGSYYTANHSSTASAFLASQGKIANLGSLGGGDSYATAVNDQGQVVGYSATTQPIPFRAFIWQDGIMTDLGGPFGHNITALAINNAGNAVGHAVDPNSGQTATLWQSGVAFDLNSLVNDRQWGLSDATGINDAGEIVGTMVRASDGVSHAFLLKPSQTPFSTNGTPLFTVSSPPDGSSVTVGQTANISTANLSGVVLVRVDFYDNDILIGSTTNAPPTLAWTPLTVGQHCLEAAGTDLSGRVISTPLACVTAAPAVSTKPRYVVADLGPLASEQSSAFGLNSRGDIVGETTVGPEQSAFVYQAGVRTLLGVSLGLFDAVGVNDNDEVVANTYNNGPYFIKNGVISPIPTLGGRQATYVEAINAQGVAAGFSSIPGLSGNSHAFLYSGGVTRDLGALPGGDVSQANAINDTGVVAGWSQGGSPGVSAHAFTWDSTNGMLEVQGTLGGNGGEAGWGINNKGVVVGDAYTPNQVRHAFVFIDGSMRDLGTLGGFNSTAAGVNNSNWVVGYSDLSGVARHGFLWVDNALYDLNDLLPSNSGWTITAANAINDAGQIAGVGEYTSTGTTSHAVLLTPLPSNAGSNSISAGVKSPANGTIFAAGPDITIVANASDQAGAIAKVVFYAGVQLIGSVTSPPYTVTWSNAPSGTWALAAVAYNNTGAFRSSEPVSILVKPIDTNAPLVAIVGAGATDYNTDIRNKLRATGLFRGVDIISVTAADLPVTPEQLNPYDAVLVYSAQAFNDPASLGNALADFEDAGGGVVLGLYSGDTSKYPLAGRLRDELYPPWAESGDNFGNFLSLVEAIPQHPIVEGVKSFDGGQDSYYQQNPTLTPGSTVVAKWSNGQPLVATRQVGGGRMVGLNFFPVSGDVRNYAWNSSTDGGRLMANALAWAAAPAPFLAKVMTQSNAISFLPGQDILFSVAISNATPQMTAVHLYASGALIASLTNAPYTYLWPRPPIGRYVVSAVATDQGGNITASKPFAITVDSELTVHLLSPTNGAAFPYPGMTTFEVSVADVNATVTNVAYYINGTQWIGASSTPPFSLPWNISVTGTFQLTAVASDTAGAVHSSAPATITVVQTNPNKPVTTAWNVGDGNWFNLSSWTDGVPRSQDTADFDNGGTGRVLAGGASAANLNIGIHSNGTLVLSGGSLAIGKTLAMGVNPGSSASFELNASGHLSEQILQLAPFGTAHFVQKGGTHAIQSYLDSSTDGQGGSYDLFGGSLSAPSEYIGSTNSGGFHQYGGTNVATGLEVGVQSRNGEYHLSGGVLTVGTEQIGVYGSHAFALLEQSGGVNTISQELDIGVSGQGILAFSGGSLKAAALVMDYGGIIDYTVGASANGIQILGKALISGGLRLHVPPGFSPPISASYPVLTWSSYYGSFSYVELPPATNGVAWKLDLRTNGLFLTVTAPPTVVVVGPVIPSAQNNLSSEVIQVANTTSTPLNGARIFITGLPAGVQVYNASGVNQGVPYLDYDSPISVGQTVQITVQFLQTGPGPLQSPAIVVRALASREAPTTSGALAISHNQVQANGSFLLEFNPTAGEIYYIQYSPDLIHWTTVSQPIVGAGANVQWVDDGPPKTSPSPQTLPFRYYRVSTSP